MSAAGNLQRPAQPGQVMPAGDCTDRLVELLTDPVCHFRPAPQAVIRRISLQSALKSFLLLIRENRKLSVFSTFIQQSVNRISVVTAHQFADPVGGKAHQVGDFGAGIVFV